MGTSSIDKHCNFAYLIWKGLSLVDKHTLDDICSFRFGFSLRAAALPMQMISQVASHHQVNRHARANMGKVALVEPARVDRMECESKALDEMKQKLEEQWGHVFGQFLFFGV